MRITVTHTPLFVGATDTQPERTYQPGETLDLAAERARILIERGYAEEAKPAKSTKDDKEG